ncbi:flagellar filament capping protein FliD [Sphingomonas donggukensis]|uniref:Flagellar hook-associated protein 2 n=1 Tax=Sphingomonas donggukensis TaxID=2949093 RepID=A0ABY4TT38_9SPHN|nr:flagellar filament capping protein FliD [Sphingomonas donggukensis]URW75566.1 flagellar filament capping protein FliD [Sphingomonas donggukensis]
MVDSIAKTLGAGSGIDIGSLVTSLVEAQYSVKSKQFENRAETLTSQISTVASLKSAMSGFSTALAGLVSGGSLATQVSSSNTGVVKATLIAGASVAGLNARIEVRSLTSGQSMATNAATPAGAHIGSGQIKVQFGSYAADENGIDTFIADATDLPAIDIAQTDGTLAGIAAKINGTAGLGLVASVVTDGTGERLVVKGPNGADKAFTLTATDDPADPGLAARINAATGTDGMARGSAAADARVAVDGIEFRRTSNTIQNLVPGVKLELQSVAPGTIVTLGTTAPTTALQQAVNDVIETFNELQKMVKAATDPATGPLARDPAAAELQRMLRNLTTTNLTGATDGSPASLASIGVVTNRDGSLSVDAGKLAKVLVANPAAVEKMFANGGTGASGKGLGAALAAISVRTTDRTYGLGASEARYSRAQTLLSDEQSRLADQQASTKTRLTQQFASMDSRVAAYRSTQAFLTQQVDAWNSGN